MATVRLMLAPEEAQFLASGFPQFVKTNGSNFPVAGLAYDASSAETAYWKLAASGYGSGNLTLTVYWYADTASSGGVVWEAAIAAITANSDSQDVETDSFATASTVADSHLGTTGQRVHSADITISNLDSLAADDLVFLKVGRLPANASDTMAGDAILLAAVLSYSDS